MEQVLPNCPYLLHSSPTFSGICVAMSWYRSEKEWGRSESDEGPVLESLCQHSSLHIVVIQRKITLTYFNIPSYRSVVFSESSFFPHQENWPPRYSWHIVESGVKHHKTNQSTAFIFSDYGFYLDIVGQFSWWGKKEDSEKTTDLSQVTDKLYHIMLYTSPFAGFELISGDIHRLPMQL
jgi:hypothetical protein